MSFKNNIDKSVNGQYENKGFEQTEFSAADAVGQQQTNALEVQGNPIQYDEILEKLGFGKAQFILVCASGLSILSNLSAQTACGMIAIASQCEFETTMAQKGAMMAVCVAGVFLSTYVWGIASDILGRRTVLMYSFFSAFSLQLFSMFVTNVWFFNAINFFMGISLGGSIAAIYPYLSEFNASKHRSVVINYSTMFVGVSAIYVPATTWLVLSDEWSINFFSIFIFRPWRLIIFFYLLPGLISALTILMFPESPKLLLAHNKEKEALKAIDWICRFNKSLTLEEILKATDIKLCPEIILIDKIEYGRFGCGIFSSIWKVTVPLFQKPHGRNVFLGATSMTLAFFSANGMQVWYPEISNRISTGNSVNISGTVCNVWDASFLTQSNNTIFQENQVCNDHISTRTYTDSIVIGVAYFVGFFLQGFLLKPIGVKRMLIGEICITILSVILLLFVTNRTIMLLLFCLYILMPGLAISNLISALVSFVPTRLRGKVVGLGLSFGRLGIMLAANLIGITLKPFCDLTFGFFAATLIVCLVLILLLPIIK